MVKYDPLVVGGRDFVHAWSDEGRYLISDETGEPYTDAYDPAELGRTYHEGDIIPVEPDVPGEDEATVEDYQDALTTNEEE